MPLKAEDRRPNGSLAVVPRLEEFKNNFAIFSEASLSDMDWSNVIVAGSAVVTCLLPVPDEHKGSKRALRQFYHDKVAPASDVDLFLYGLTEEQAIEKIKHIEDRIKNAILHETTTIRTKNAITIVSQYPTRHVQIVLRIYKSIAEVLTGFDVDCSCAAYDGKQVYASPRALASYITQKNTIDLSRRSPSYENRLSKYSRRGFEVFWPQLDRSRIDPTIFERSFSRTVGLARLLVLEQLPLASDREDYLRQRRQERGRPEKWPPGGRNVLAGNIKDKWEDEVPEWLEEEELSNYHTFTIPYGRNYHARKIERLFYNQDLLLNAEWNKPKDRDVLLHRHPAFFGNVEDIIHDCCGHCPTPVTEEEKEIAERESKIYVSGDVSFIKDDPGRQEIGSFNPITETDWTEMAYVGNTERLCQAIVDHDLETVKAWLSQESADPNTRDYTGRTPLHLACMASTPPIVQCLVDHGARLTARVADGRTALHFAAARGAVEIVRILLSRSELNEAEEDRKLQLRKGQSEKQDQSVANQSGDDKDTAEMDISLDETTSYTLGSFVKVEKDPAQSDANHDVAEDDSTDEPDIYDINVVSWDSHTSPLHLAIINGHVDVVQELVSSWGADVLLPVKLLNEYNNTPRASILTLVLALCLPLDKAITMTEKLLQLGASPLQADVAMYTPLHYIAGTSSAAELLDIFVQQSKPAAQKAINQLAITGGLWSPSGQSPLTLAIRRRNVIGALKLLENGVSVSIDFEAFINSAKVVSDSIRRNNTDHNRRTFHENVDQPIIDAVQNDLPELAIELLRRGADPNSLDRAGYKAKFSDCQCDWEVRTAKSLLDLVHDKIQQLGGFKATELPDAPEPREIDKHYFDGLEEGTYRMWHARNQLEKAQAVHQKNLEDYRKEVKDFKSKQNAIEAKARAVADLRVGFKKLEATLLEKGGKPWKALFPELAIPNDNATVAVSAAKTNSKTSLKVAFTFLLPDLTDARKEGYLSLFEAAWCGDLATIKQLTLGPWGENKERPLQLAVQDESHLSPLSVAIFRGHYELAKPMLQIIQAQYKKEEQKGHVRYEMATESDYYGSESGDDESNPFPIYSTIIDDQFTIDDIGAVAAQVESDVSPLQAFHWNCPAYLFLDKSKRGSRNPRSLLQYAILADDIGLLRLLLQLGQHFTGHKAQDGELPIYDPGESVFHLAIENDRLRCLEELIKTSGPSFPLNMFVQRSGADENEKPRYYQGLSVHGKKRTDWARRPNYFGFSNPMYPPLLYSAYCGNLQSTEWFLTTAPGRYYLEFTKNHSGDKQMQLLANSKDGIEKPLMSWLNSGNHLVLHCAILSKQTDDSRHLVEYLINNVPGCLEKKSEEGHTPLALAFSYHRVTFADILIKAGANQAVRDGQGHNLLHLLLCGVSGGMAQSGGDPGNVAALLGLFDQRLVPSLLTERASGSLTPLSRWLHEAAPITYYSSSWYMIQHTHKFNRNMETDNMVDIARYLLEFAAVTNQKHLELLDGAGNSPVHDAVKRQLPRVLKLMLDYRPDLLLRENATGATPLELAADAWVHEVTISPPKFESGESTSLDGEVTQRSEREAIYDLCRSKVVQRPGKRKLVSLNEANEVAKRLAMKTEARNGPNDTPKPNNDADTRFNLWCRDARRIQV
ncbi:ankyrin repeat-containing domain protein [Aspergillus floccosus]